MNSATPPSFTGGAAAPALYPLNWSVLNPTPTDRLAYPIGGFAYFELYSCYGSATDVDALVGTKAGRLGLIRWYFGTASENGNVPAAVLQSQGFNLPPGGWVNAARQLLITNTLSRVGTPHKANTACATIAKGA